MNKIAEKLIVKKTGNVELKKVEILPTWFVEGREPVEGIDYEKEGKGKETLNFGSKLNFKKN